MGFLDDYGGERGVLTSFYRAKLAALCRDASGRTLAALREAVRDERRAAMRALAEKWAIRRAAAQEVCRKRNATPVRPAFSHLPKGISTTLQNTS